MSPPRVADDLPAIRTRIHELRSDSRPHAADDFKRFPRLLRWYSDEIGLFGAKHAGGPKPVVNFLPSAPHYIYITQEAEVVRLMRKFLV
jgi:hypothetical protein